MKINFKILLLLYIVHYCSFSSNAQIIKAYNYQQLSSTAYEKLSDSLKNNKNCPILFEEKKVQKEYEKVWRSRNEYVSKSIENNNYVKDEVVLPYIQDIVNEIISNNRKLIPYNVTVLLDRSEIANAVSFGEHIIAVNAGIIIRAKSREELAFYIGHELSHDILQHSNNSMFEQVQILNSDEYKESLKNVLSSKYERYSRLMKVAQGFTFDRGRHSRYSEQAADSLGVILVTNSNLSFDASYFLNLDTMSNQYNWPLRRNIKEHIKDLGIAANAAWFVKKSKGLSSFNYDIVDTSGKIDSLKTHPDCKLRYEHNLANNSKVLKKTPIPQSVLDAAFEIAIMDLYVNKDLTKCFYRLIQEKENRPQLQEYEFLSHAVLYSLLNSVVGLERFNVLRIKKKKDVSADFFELQNFFEQVPEKELSEICAQLATNKQYSDKEALALFEYYKISTTVTSSGKRTSNEDFIKNYQKNYPNSIFLEIF
jgi:hypothetical protein